MKYIFLLFALFFSVNIAFSQDVFIINDIQEAKVQAEQTDTELLLVFTADWCRYCGPLYDDIIANIDKIKETHTVCFVDFDTNRALAAKYGVKSIPASVRMKKNIKRTGYNQNFNSYMKFLEL